MGKICSLSSDQVHALPLSHFAAFLRRRFLGHGAPALLSCLWLENSLSTYYTQYTRDKDGLHRLISRFSVPGGFPRRVNLL